MNPGRPAGSWCATNPPGKPHVARATAKHASGESGAARGGFHGDGLLGRATLCSEPRHACVHRRPLSSPVRELQSKLSVRGPKLAGAVVKGHHARRSGGALGAGCEGLAPSETRQAPTNLQILMVQGCTAAYQQKNICAQNSYFFANTSLLTIITCSDRQHPVSSTAPLALDSTRVPIRAQDLNPHYCAAPAGHKQYVEPLACTAGSSGAQLQRLQELCPTSGIHSWHCSLGTPVSGTSTGALPLNSWQPEPREAWISGINRQHQQRPTKEDIQRAADHQG